MFERVQAAAHGEDRVRKGTQRWSAGDSRRERPDVLPHRLDIFVSRDWRDHLVSRGPDERHTVQACRIPADEPVVTGLDGMERLARADHRRRRRTISEAGQSPAGYVDNLNPVIPLRVPPRDRVMPQREGFQLIVTQVVIEHRQQVDVADVLIEVAGDARPIQVQADEVLTQDRGDRLLDIADYGPGRRGNG